MKKISDIVGMSIFHFNYGWVKVIKVYSYEKGIIEIKIINGGETRRIVLSSRFFDNVDDYYDYYKDNFSENLSKRFIASKTRKENKRVMFRDYSNSNYSGERNNTRDEEFEASIGEQNIELDNSTYTCDNCGFEKTSFLDMSACPNCGSDEFYDTTLE